MHPGLLSRPMNWKPLCRFVLLACCVLESYELVVLMSAERALIELPLDTFEDVFFSQEIFTDPGNAYSLAQLVNSSTHIRHKILPNVRLKPSAIEPLADAVQISEALFHSFLNWPQMVRYPDLASLVFFVKPPICPSQYFFADFDIDWDPEDQLPDEVIVNMLSLMQKEPSIVQSEAWQMKFLTYLPRKQWPVFARGLGPLLLLSTAGTIYESTDIDNAFYTKDFTAQGDVLMLLKFACATKGDVENPWWDAVRERIQTEEPDEHILDILKWQSGKSGYNTQLLIYNYLTSLESGRDDLWILCSILDLMSVVISGPLAANLRRIAFYEIISRNYQYLPEATWSNFLENLNEEDLNCGLYTREESPKEIDYAWGSLPLISGDYKSMENDLSMLPYGAHIPYELEEAVHTIYHSSSMLWQLNGILARRFVHNHEFIHHSMALSKVFLNDPRLYTLFREDPITGLCTFDLSSPSFPSDVSPRELFVAYLKALPVSVLFEDVNPKIIMVDPQSWAEGDDVLEAAIKSLFTREPSQGFIDEIRSTLAVYWEFDGTGYDELYRLILEKHQKYWESKIE